MAQSNNKSAVHLECLKTNDLRLLNFYLRALALNLPTLLHNRNPAFNVRVSYPPKPYNETPHLKKIIKDAIYGLQDRSQLQALDSSLITLGNQEILPEDLFSWLKESHEASMFLWLLLEVNRNFYPLEWSGGYEYFTYPTPISHEEIYQNILDSFDHSFYAGSYPYNKEGLLNQLKTDWTHARESTPKLSWLMQSDEEESINWAWEYVRRYCFPLQHQQHTAHQKNFRLPYNAPNTESKKYGLIAALQHWGGIGDSQALFYQRINRAWSQRKTRKTREDMKAINTYISVQHKEMLDKLSKYNRFRMNEMLEFIIEDAYEQQRQDIENKYGK